MKKNRPGVLLSVLAPEAVLPALEEILFRETATFGIRRYPVSRHKLNRQPCTGVYAVGARCRESSAGKKAGRRSSRRSTRIGPRRPATRCAPRGLCAGSTAYLEQAAHQ